MKRRTDSIPAILTPKEAVLNRNAAELLGRNRIAALNAHGNALAKRGVDLAFDPTPGPSTMNLMGYEMGVTDVGRDDRGDLLKEADSIFWGGGGVPVPTPTPTPVPRGYQYGTDDVEDRFAPYGSGAATSKTVKSFIRRYGLPNSRGNVTTPTPSGGTATVGQSPGYSDEESIDIGSLTRFPVSQSQYIGASGAVIGPQYDPKTGTVNPLPKGAVGVQGAPNANVFNRSLQGSLPASANVPIPATPLTHSQMATDIARRNLTSTGSVLGTPPSNLPSNVQLYISPEEAAAKGLQFTGGDEGWQPYVSPQEMTDQNLMYTGGPSSGSADASSRNTTRFLPPGFTTSVGSTGVAGSTDDDINFLPPGFNSVQGSINPINQQLQRPKDEGYGSAYGY